MAQEEFVIFAEIRRDHFDEILQSLIGQFKDIESGRQGDDWIWIHLGFFVAFQWQQHAP